MVEFSQPRTTTAEVAESLIYDTVETSHLIAH
jgi:hypothetical protein